MDPDYSELDWEYLPNGGWGIIGPTLYQTTWESFIPEPNWKMDNVSNNTRVGRAGWHTLVTQVGNGKVKYLLDGKQRRKSIKFQDTVPAPVPALISPCDF